MKTTSGELFKRKTKKHGMVYELRYQVDGKRHKVTIKTEDGRHVTNKRDAENARDKILAPLRAKDEVARRRAVASHYQDALDTAKELEEANREKLTIADAWQHFAGSTDRPQCSSVTLEDYERRWRKFVDWMAVENGGITVMEHVTRTIARDFVKTLDKSGLSANRRNKIIQGCKLVFATLSEDCGMMQNPFSGIKNKTLTTRSHRELSEGELLTVCQSADGEMRTLLAVGIYTAMRLGDACLLRWEDIMLDRNQISIMPRKTRRLGKRLVIPIHSILKSILEETPRPDRVGYVVPKLAVRYERDAAAVCKILRRHFESCGIDTQERHPDQKQATCIVGFHSLRHSFVSMCATKGVPLAVVQELCGHGSPAIQKHYIHIGEDAILGAMQALPSITGDEARPTPRDELKAVVERLSDAQIIEVLEFTNKIQKNAEKRLTPVENGGKL